MYDLFPSRAYRIGTSTRLRNLLITAEEAVDQGAVVPVLDMERFRTELGLFNFDSPRGLNGTIDWVVEQMTHGLVHINHPRYFGLFNPTPTFPSQCADQIIASFNPQLATWTSSPVAVEIENHVIRAVATRVGFPADAKGHFTSGGSEANYTSVIAALTAAPHNGAVMREFDSDYGRDGVFAFKGQPIIYVSKDCHLAWIKIAQMAGIGRSAVHLIDTDDFGQLDCNALLAAIENDFMSGKVPLMVVATAGTTNAGMIDPLIQCADIAQKYRLWFHVDAAWGGGLIAADQHRHVLAGIERADSVTIDAHKWFATTMGCGIFITRQQTVLSDAFRVLNNFMPSNNVASDPYVSSVQWSRRFSGLRLFLSLATVGWDGYERHVSHSLRLIEVLKQQLECHGWTIANRSPVGVLCVIPPDPATDVRKIVSDVLASGEAWVSVATFGGRNVIRACVTSGITQENDVSILVNALNRANESVLAA